MSWRWSVCRSNRAEIANHLHPTQPISTKQKFSTNLNLTQVFKLASSLTHPRFSFSNDGVIQKFSILFQITYHTVQVIGAMHNVLFGQYVYLPTEQAGTYPKSYVLIPISHLFVSTCLVGRQTWLSRKPGKVVFVFQFYARGLSYCSNSTLRNVILQLNVKSKTLLWKLSLLEELFRKCNQVYDETCSTVYVPHCAYEK